MEHIALYYKAEEGKMVSREEAIKGCRVKRVGKPVTMEKKKAFQNDERCVYLFVQAVEERKVRKFFEL